MERKMYEMTERQIQNWARMSVPQMPADEEFQAMWKKAHHGKVSGWGMGKRNWIVSEMKNTREYQMGIWQGRVDAARGLDYSEERNDNTYNLGYYRGYTNYQSDMHGIDTNTRQQFAEKYMEA